MLAMFLASAGCHFLSPTLGDKYALLTFWVAVVFASWFGGLNPGLLALSLSIPLICTLVMEPRGSFQVEDFQDRVGLVLYMVAGLAVALMGGSMRLARDRAEGWARDAEERRDLLEREVADRVRAELALREIQERLELVIDAADVGVWDYDPTRTWLVFNQRCQDLFGLRLEANADLEVIRRAVHRDDRDRLDEAIRRAIDPRGRGDLHVEFRSIGPEGGAERWVVARGRSLFDGGGRVVRVIGTLLEITAGKRAEHSARFLADSSAVLTEIAEERATLGHLARLAVPFFADWCVVDLAGPEAAVEQVAIAHRDPDHVALALEVASRYPTLLQHDRGPGLSIRTGESQIVPEIPPEMLRDWARDADHLAMIERLGFRSWICVPLKGRRGTLGALSFLSSDSGRRFGPEDLALADDLGRRAAIAIENARLHGELTEADRRKDEFLAVLAHELRNPLATIRNALHLMQPGDPGAAEAGIEAERAMAAQQVTHLASLVDDLMDVSRISLGKIELRMGRVDVGRAMARVAESVTPAARARGHSLHVAYPDGPAEVEADATRLDQVLGNLLTNAIKYTGPGGRIALAATVEGGEVAIRVGDTGLGISAEMLPRIFEMFVQVEPRGDRTTGGLGIGLGLVRNLVEMHGGRVAVRSPGLGEGSEFVVTLPLLTPLATAAPQPDRRAPGLDRSATPRRRILVVDDNEDAARSLARILERFYAQEVRVAHDGPSALDLASLFRPELVLLDIGMPGMGGHEVAMALRRKPETEHAVLVALTGWGQEKDRALSREAGFDLHLVKPVAPETLGEILARPSGVAG